MAEIHLSPRETQVLQGIVDGKTMDCIGYELGITSRTVRLYAQKLRAKFGAQSIAEAAAKSVALGLAKVDIQRMYIVIDIVHSLSSSL